MKFNQDETETIHGEIVAVTESAILIDTGSGEHWVPRSLIIDGDSFSEFCGSTEFEIAEWFVEKEGLY